MRPHRFFPTTALAALALLIIAASAVASKTARSHSCTTAGAAAGTGSSCPVSKSAAVPAVVAKGGMLTGDFDTSMSGVCQGACAAKVAFKPENVIAQPGARNGQLTQCPVSGVVFKVRNGNAAVVHDGRTFYTCCGSCAERLQAKPDRFLTS